MSEPQRRVAILNELLQAGIHLEAAERQLVHAGDRERIHELGRLVRQFRHELQRRQLPRGSQLL